MYTGPEIDDPEILARLPVELRRRIEEHNGYLAFDGGLHVRGACREPAWHSLRDAWEAFHRHYDAVLESDIPFAEDCVGDQWLLRDGQVIRLFAETGEVEPLGLDVNGFFAAVEDDPVETLGLQPLRQLGHALEPGQLINVYPPFCTKEAADGVSLRAISAEEQRDFLWTLARQLKDVPDGGRVRFRVE